LCRNGWIQELVSLFNFYLRKLSLKEISLDSDPPAHLSRFVSSLLLGPTNIHGCTGLHLACLHGHTSVAEFLLKCMDQPDLREECERVLTHKTNANEWTALHLAVTKGNES